MAQKTESPHCPWCGLASKTKPPRLSSTHRVSSSPNERHGVYKDEDGQTYEDMEIDIPHWLYVCGSCSYAEIHTQPIREG